MKTEKRLNREKETVQKMIALYCYKNNHAAKDALCDDCQELLDYAIHRIDHCPYGVEKPTYAKCPIHCYRPEMRDRIRQVMRFSGPRMLIYHPRLAMYHLVDELFSKLSQLPNKKNL